ACWQTGWMQDVIQVSEQLPFKAVLVEPKGLPPGRVRGKIMGGRLEGLQGCRETIGALFGEPPACRLMPAPWRNDGLGRPTLAVGDHRRAARLGFDRHDADVLLAGKKQ